VRPGKGAGGAELQITAKVDQSLIACPLRLLLGVSPFGHDPTIRPDGSISERRSVPNALRPGTSTVRLAMASGQILAEAPFEILKSSPWPWRRVLLQLFAAAGAVVVGALARAAVHKRRIGAEHPRDEPTRKEPTQARPLVRAEPHASRMLVTLDPDTQSSPAFTIRLQPHDDIGTQTVKETAA